MFQLPSGPSLDKMNDADLQPTKVENQIDQSNPNQLIKLPANLIGHCASFLPHKSFNSLLCTRRSIYQDCTSPRLLTALNLPKQILISDSGVLSPFSLTEIDFTCYPRAKRLAFDIMNLPTEQSEADEVLNDIANIHPLRALELCVELGHRQLSLEVNEANIRKLNFIAQNQNFVSKIEELKLNLSGFYNLTHLSPVIQFLSAFRNVRLLDLDGDNNHRIPDDLSIFAYLPFTFTMPSLIGLKLSGKLQALGVPLLRAIKFKSKLQFFSIRYLCAMEVGD